MRDLRDPRWLWLKGILFLLIAGASAVLLWLEMPSLRTAVLLALTIWGFCRAYYFAFYVVEKYADPGFRFAGLGSFLVYVFRRRLR